MSPTEFQRIAQQIEYKPGWRLQVLDSMRDPFRSVNVVGTAEVQDAYGGGPTTIMRREIIDLYMVEHFDERSAVDYFYRFIREMEHHEIGEWFRYRGARPFDPHREHPLVDEALRRAA